MSREPSHSCASCEQTFGSKWALTEHAKSCPVKRNAELARIHEALAWKQERVERAIGLCYRYAARAFAAHHSARLEEAHRFRQWFTEEYQEAAGELEQLHSGLLAASKLLFPRLERMKREAGTLLEQIKDLVAIDAVMNRLFAGIGS